MATSFIESQCSVENPAFINEITLCELVWVLKRAYRYDKPVILSVLHQLFETNEVHISSHEEAIKAYQNYEKGNADFSDYFISEINKKFDCEFTLSFDKNACQSGNFKLLE